MSAEPQIPRVLVAHPGTQYSHHLARELHRRGALESFHTTLALAADSLSGRFLAPLAQRLGLQRAFQNRSLEGVEAQRLFCDPWLELRALLQMRRGGGPLAVLHARNEKFQERIPRDHLQAAQVILGFDTSSWILAQRAADLKKPFVLDRSIGSPRAYRRVEQELRQAYPEWLEAEEEKPAGWIGEEDREHALAERVVVPSRFVARTLEEDGVPAKRIRINPFGTDTALFRPGERHAPGETLRFLFAGSLGARKGLPLLLNAWRALNPAHAELWIAGSGQIPAGVREGTAASVRWLGGGFAHAHGRAHARGGRVCVPEFF